MQVRGGPRPDRPGDRKGIPAALLNPDDPAIDATAVLAPANLRVGAIASQIREAGLGVVLLHDYHGRATPGVKVGTFSRARGHEFMRVIIPSLDSSFPWGSQVNIENASPGRTALRCHEPRS